MTMVPDAPILVLNAGSSSLKYQLLQPFSGHVHIRGLVERIGEADVPSYAVALSRAAADLAAHPAPAAIGHRVVHGGPHYRRPTLITDQVRGTIHDLESLAPLHNPANAALIDAAVERYPQLPQVAVFDTAFFADLPARTTTYAIDQAVAARYGIRRYGFHGISHDYVSHEAAAVVGRPFGELNQIVLHLGNGASITAIERGRPIDTSMGFTPLEGLVMGTRGGDIDPGALVHLLRHGGLDTDGLDRLLNRGSGMVGLTGHIDLRDVHGAAAAGDERAVRALEIYAYRARKYIGAYLAALGTVDAVTFTAGVGENDAAMRAAILTGLEPLGIALDPHRNRGRGDGPRRISTDTSRTTILVVPTDEERAIARDTAAVVASGMG